MVKYLTNKNEQYPIRVSNYALRKLSEIQGKDVDLTELLGNQSMESLNILFFYSLESGYIGEGKSFPFKNMNDPKFFNLSEDCFFDFIKLIPDFFTELLKNQESNQGLIQRQINRKKSKQIQN